MQRLIPRLDGSKMAGTVIVVPIINIASWTSMTPRINPVDRKGMNASYPGDASGTQTQRALAAITNAVVAPGRRRRRSPGGRPGGQPPAYRLVVRVRHAAPAFGGVEVDQGVGGRRSHRPDV